MIFFILRINLIIFSFIYIIIFFSWGILGLRSYFLIFFNINWEYYFNSKNTILVNRFGDFFILLFCILIFFNINFIIIFFLIFIIIFIIIITKRTTFPFIIWLPKAIRTPTPISSLVHRRRTLVTAGFVLLIKFNYFFIDWINLCIIFFIFLRSFRSLFNLFEKDLKKIITLRTLSQINFCIILFSLNIFWFGFFHLISYAFFKRNLFINFVFLIDKNVSEQNKNEFFRKNKFLLFRFLISLLCLFGLFFYRGIIIRNFLFEITDNISLNEFFILFFSIIVIFSLIYGFIFIKFIFKNIYFKFYSFN